MRSPVASDYEDSDDWESSSPGSSVSSRSPGRGGRGVEHRRDGRRVGKRRSIERTDDRRRKRSRSGSSGDRRRRSPSFTESSDRDDHTAGPEVDEEDSPSRSSVAVPEAENGQGVDEEKKGTEQPMNVLFANFVPIRPLNPVELTPFIVYQVFREFGFPQRILILSERRSTVIPGAGAGAGETPAAQGSSTSNQPQGQGTSWNDDGSRLRERMDAAYRGGRRGGERNEGEGAPSSAFLGPQKTLIQFENKETATKVMAALNEKVIQLAIPQPATVSNSSSGALIAKPTPPRVEFGFRLFLKPSPGDKVFVHKNTDKMFVLTPQAIPLMGPIFDRFEGDWNASDFASSRGKLGFVKPQGIHIQPLPAHSLPTQSQGREPQTSKHSAPIHIGRDAGRSPYGEGDWRRIEPSTERPTHSTRPDHVPIQHQPHSEPAVTAGHQTPTLRIAPQPESYHPPVLENTFAPRARVVNDCAPQVPPAPTSSNPHLSAPAVGSASAPTISVGMKRRQYVPPAPAVVTTTVPIAPPAPAGPEW
jgi:hypothetical protein